MRPKLIHTQIFDPPFDPDGARMAARKADYQPPKGIIELPSDPFCPLYLLLVQVTTHLNEVVKPTWYLQNKPWESRRTVYLGHLRHYINQTPIDSKLGALYKILKEVVHLPVEIRRAVVTEFSNSKITAQMWREAFRSGKGIAISDMVLITKYFLFEEMGEESRQHFLTSLFNYFGVEEGYTKTQNELDVATVTQHRTSLEPASKICRYLIEGGESPPVFHLSEVSPHRFLNTVDHFSKRFDLDEVIGEFLTTLGQMDPSRWNSIIESLKAVGADPLREVCIFIRYLFENHQAQFFNEPKRNLLAALIEGFRDKLEGNSNAEPLLSLIAFSTILRELGEVRIPEPFPQGDPFLPFVRELSSVISLEDPERAEIRDWISHIDPVTRQEVPYGSKGDIKNRLIQFFHTREVSVDHWTRIIQGEVDVPVKLEELLILFKYLVKTNVNGNALDHIQNSLKNLATVIENYCTQFENEMLTPLSTLSGAIQSLVMGERGLKKMFVIDEPAIVALGSSALENVGPGGDFKEAIKVFTSALSDQEKKDQPPGTPRPVHRDIDYECQRLIERGFQKTIYVRKTDPIDCADLANQFIRTLQETTEQKVSSTTKETLKTLLESELIKELCYENIPQLTTRCIAALDVQRKNIEELEESIRQTFQRILFQERSVFKTKEEIDYNAIARSVTAGLIAKYASSDYTAYELAQILAAIDLVMDQFDKQGWRFLLEQEYLDVSRCFNGHLEYYRSRSLARINPRALNQGLSNLEVNLANGLGGLNNHRRNEIIRKLVEQIGSFISSLAMTMQTSRMIAGNLLKLAEKTTPYGKEEPSPEAMTRAFWLISGQAFISKAQFGNELSAQLANHPFTEKEWERLLSSFDIDGTTKLTFPEIISLITQSSAYFDTLTATQKKTLAWNLANGEKVALQLTAIMSTRGIEFVERYHEDREMLRALYKELCHITQLTPNEEIVPPSITGSFVASASGSVYGSPAPTLASSNLSWGTPTPAQRQRSRLSSGYSSPSSASSSPHHPFSIPPFSSPPPRLILPPK